MINLIDVLLFSLIFALTTMIHNKLYVYNKTLFIVVCTLLIETILYKIVPTEIYYFAHIWIIIIIVWGLIIYTFRLKYISSKCIKYKFDRRKNNGFI